MTETWPWQPELAELASNVSRIMTPMVWAEDEIAKASKVHPDEADLLHHAFLLLTAGTGMDIEFIYRGHAAELLERVALGQDTRPATAAEVCLICCEASLRAPMHGAGFGLYGRMWLAAFPDHPAYDGQADQQVHYERIEGSAIDDLEREVRRKAASPGRRLGPITCRGQHHAEPVHCRFAKEGT